MKMKRTDTPARVSTGCLARVAAERGRGKAIIEAFLAVKPTDVHPLRVLRRRLVDHIYAVSSPMSTGHALLIVKTKRERRHITELAHVALQRTEGVTDTESSRQSALNASVGVSSIWRKARGPKGKYLTRGKLLLIQSLLVLLQSFDLILDSNLKQAMSEHLNI